MGSSSNGLGNLPFKQDNKGSTPLGPTKSSLRGTMEVNGATNAAHVGSSPIGEAILPYPNRQRKQVESLFSKGSSPFGSTNHTVPQMAEGARSDRV